MWVVLNPRKEREKLIKKKQHNTITITKRVDEFSINIKNRFSYLNDGNEDDTEEVNDKSTKTIMEAMEEGLEVGNLQQGTVVAGC